MPDLIIDGLVIADPKVVETFSATHRRQILGDLTITKLKLVLLLNFNLSTPSCSGSASSVGVCREWRRGRNTGKRFSADHADRRGQINAIINGEKCAL